MRLMTYNVQSGRDAWGQLRLDGCCDMIKRLDPDILGLNELRRGCADSGNVDQPAYIADKTGMEHRFAKAIPMGGTGKYGIGLLSRCRRCRLTSVNPVTMNRESFTGESSKRPRASWLCTALISG